MTRQNHIIGQQVFRVDMPAREHVQELYHHTSRLFNNELAGMMENLFDKMIPEDQLMKIDTLEIDLGSCAYADFENTLVERLIPALEKELSSRLLMKAREGASGSNDTQLVKTSPAALLLYYLTTGALPWWATGELLTDPGKTLGHLLAENPSGLKALLREASQHEHARRRLVYQFSEQQLRDVISLFESREAVFIFEYHAEIIHIQQQEQVVQAEISEFKKAVWLFILTFLLVDQGSHFDRKMFVKSTLSQMSAHFNISYEEILLLFSAALKEGYEPGAKDALPLLIRELLEEYTHTQPSAWRDQHDPYNEKEAQALAIQKQYKLLRYYLLLGSLPWNEAHSREDLSAVFTALKNAAPVLARQLLMDTGAHESARKRMAAFDEPFVMEIVKLVEPAHAGFITGYAAKLQELQAAKHMVRIRNDDFRESLWEFILAFLFTDTGSVFNSKMFVQNHVQRMARHYNIQFHELLVFLAQGIGEDYRSFTDNTSLFYLLTGILKEQAESHEPASENIPDASKPAPGVALRDIIRYWLEYGFMPWWAEGSAHLSPGHLLAELIRRSPADALLLLELSGANAGMKHRFLQHVPEDTMLMLFGLLPEGMAAQALVRSLSEATGKIAPMQDTQIRSTLLALLWDSYHASSYNSFDAGGFISAAVSGLSVSLQAPSQELLASLKQSDQQLFAMSPGTPRKENVFVDTAAGLFFDHADIGLQDLLVQQAGKAPGKEALLAEALQMLDYFLVWNAWPAHVEIPAEDRSGALLRQLILFIYSENSQALRNLLKKDTHAAQARMQLHDAFSLERNNVEKNISALLSGHFNSDMMLYLKHRHAGDMQEGEKLGSLFNRVLRLSDGQARQDAWRRLFHSPSVIRQAAYHYQGDDFYQVMRAVGAEKSESFLKDLQYLLNMSGRDTLERAQLSLLFREFSLLFFSGTSPAHDVKRYLREFFAFLSARGKNTAYLYAAFLKTSAVLAEHSSSGITQLIPVLHESMQERSRFEAARVAIMTKAEISAQKTMNVSGSPAEGPGGNMDEIINELDKKKRMEEENRKKKLQETQGHEQEKIYVRNAGLVLLHPFLSTYFTRTGLMENNKFISPETQRRAVHLLQYAATGTDECEEHWLVFNKVLCGIAPEEAVEKSLLLTDQEKQVTDEMLGMVIRRWEKLGNTSVTGLRESFLARDGALMPGDEAWTLRVEQKAYDVLLSYLPWAFGVIKTSWMPKQVHVEWI